jgi:hypothetical protein
MKVFKYQSINLNLLNSLRKKTNWYSKLHLLNDPFECFFIDNTNTRIYTDFISTLATCCFSKNMNEILMWSHYANNHKGLCLEFEIEEEILKEQLLNVDYSNTTTLLDEVKTTKTGHLDLNISANGKFLWTKFENWGYEEELRTYVFCDELDIDGKEKPFLGELTAIYFGKNSNTEDIELIKHNSTHFDSLKYFKVDLDLENMKMSKLTEV